MKAQVQELNAKTHRSQLRAFAAVGLAAALVIAWPGRSQAHDQYMSSFHSAGHEARGGFEHHGGAQAHYAAAGTMRADWHGGVGFHAAGPGYHAGYGVGWHGGGGRWDHGWHGGHFGWWYIDAGVWTLYPYYPGYYYPYGYPYYAYPAPYGYVAPQSPAVNSNLPAPPQSWYYCDAARGYYPYVQNCPSGWRAVAAQPAPSSAPAPAPVAPPQ